MEITFRTKKRNIVITVEMDEVHPTEVVITPSIVFDAGKPHKTSEGIMVTKEIGLAWLKKYVEIKWTTNW